MHEVGGQTAKTEWCNMHANGRGERPFVFFLKRYCDKHAIKGKKEFCNKQLIL